MKKFNFRLESVLKLRKFKTDNANLELQKVLAEKVERLNSIVEYGTEVKNLNKNDPNNGKKIFSLQTNYHRKRFIEQEIKRLESEILNIEEIESQKRNNLAEFLKGQKALEKYKEKKYEEYKYLINKEENELIEEIALRKFHKSDFNQ